MEKKMEKNARWGRRNTCEGTSKLLSSQVQKKNYQAREKEGRVANVLSCGNSNFYIPGQVKLRGKKKKKQILLYMGGHFSLISEFEAHLTKSKSRIFFLFKSSFIYYFNHLEILLFFTKFENMYVFPGKVYMCMCKSRSMGNRNCH